MHSQLLNVTLPPGSRCAPPDDARETCEVPSSIVDEIADLRRQLPVGEQFDGLNYCGDEVNKVSGSVAWSWSTGQNGVFVSVDESGNPSWGSASSSEVTLGKGQDPSVDGCGDSSIVKDGIFTVGKDIQPGTYQSDGGDGCYWARLSGFGGTVGEIIANSVGAGPQTVTIGETDKGFKTERCGIWQKQN